MDDLQNILLGRHQWVVWSNIWWRNATARLSVWYYFCLEGILAGVLSSAVARIQDSLNLNDSQLGVGFLFFYAGTVFIFPCVTMSLRTVRCRYSLLGYSILVGICMPIVPLTAEFWAFCLAMLLFGLNIGGLDVSVNSSAVLAEIVAGFPLMGSFHGWYSIAAAIGSVSGGFLFSVGLTTFDVFILFSATSIVLSISLNGGIYGMRDEQAILLYKEKISSIEYSSLLSINDEDGASDMDNAVDCEDSSGGRGQQAASGLGYISNSGVGDLNQRLLSSSHSSESQKCDVGIKFGGQGAEVEESTKPEDSESQVVRDSSGRSGAVYYSMSKDLKDEDQPATSDVSDENQINDSSSPTSHGSVKQLAVLCCVGFLGAFGESSILTWSVIYYNRNIHSSATVQTFGVASFLVAMAAGRFSCDYLRRVAGRRVMVAVGGMLAFGGLFVVYLAPLYPFAVVMACMGFVLCGMGLSTLLPTVFSSAGHIIGRHSGTSVAIAAACTYVGSIISSPLVGIISDATGSLRTALLCDAIVLGMLLPLSYGVPSEDAIRS